MDPKMSVLTYLLALIEMIPGTFWGVIIGGFFTLGGIILTNRAHDRRTRDQLTDDRKLKNREREMALRKDIYLAATEAASAGLFAVGRFANLDIPHDKVTEGYLDKAPSITKVHIIATEETVRAVSNFSIELNAAFLRLSVKRFQLVAQKQQIESLRAQFDISNKENSRTLELQKQYNIEGLVDPRKWDVLQRNFEFERARGERVRQEADILNASLIPRQLQFLEEVCNETIRLGRLLTPPLFSIRKELELPIDETEFHRISEEATTKQVESLKAFMRDLQSLIAAQRAASGEPPPAPDS
jgi:hypothetical protein